MIFVAGMADYSQDDDVVYVWYRFVLDAAREVGYTAYHNDDDRTVSMCKALERNAIGLWRSEESDNVIRQRMTRMVDAAEQLLAENNFSVEWMDGYTIYYDDEEA